LSQKNLTSNLQLLGNGGLPVCM